MPRQLFFLHTSEKLVHLVPPPAQAQWLRHIRQFFASTWTEDAEVGELPCALVRVPPDVQHSTPKSTYGQFQQAIFPSIPWMKFQRESVWGTLRLDAKLSEAFWQMTKRPDHAARPIDLLFVLLRDPKMPMPLKHRDWIIHGYPKWPGVVAASRPSKPSVPTSRAALPP